MAQFRATIQGNRGDASRLGTKSSGLDVTCNGWNLGASASVGYDEDKEEDYVNINLTTGSSYSGKYLPLFYGTQAEVNKILEEQPAVVFLNHNQLTYLQGLLEQEGESLRKQDDDDSDMEKILLDQCNDRLRGDK